MIPDALPARVPTSGKQANVNTYTTLRSSGRKPMKKLQHEYTSASSSCDDATLDSGEFSEGEWNTPSKNKSGSAGLSELSKQLRVLQGTNQSQSSTIERLERQLKIMSDLKGVSVADLKSALVDACQSEAYSELLAQVSSLQAQLANAKGLSRAPVNNQIEFEQEASNNKIAALELRAGELEEIEESLRKEMKRLYQRAEEQSSKSTRLVSNAGQYVTQIDSLKKSLDESLDREKDYQVREARSRVELQQADSLQQESQLQLKLEQEKAERLVNLVTLKEKEKKQKIKEIRSMMNADMVQIQNQLSKQIERSAGLENINNGQKVEIDSLRENSLQRAIETKESTDIKVTAINAEITQLRKKVQEVDHIIEVQRQKCQVEIKTKEEASRMYMVEVEGRLRDETQSLFTLWDKESSRATKLEAAYNQEKTLVASLREELASSKVSVSHRQNDAGVLQAEIETLQSKVREAELHAQVETERATNMKEEIKARDKDTKLRKKQFKTRFQVQADRIVDLEQQVSSLYSAIGMFQSDRSEEQANTYALQTTLNDNAIAQHIHSDLIETDTEKDMMLQREQTDAEIAHQLHIIEGQERNPPQGVSTPTNTQKASVPMSPPTTVIVGIHAGWLLKKDRITGWKNRFFVLRGNFEAGVFYLHYADHPNKPIKGNIFIQNQSILSPTKAFSKYPFAFTIESDPSNPKGEVTYLAADSAKSLKEWKAAIHLLKSSKRTPAFPVGSAVVIDGPHESYNGLTGVVQSEIKEDGHQRVWVDSLERIIAIPPDHLKRDRGPSQSASVAQAVLPVRDATPEQSPRGPSKRASQQQQHISDQSSRLVKM